VHDADCKINFICVAESNVESTVSCDLNTLLNCLNVLETMANYTYDRVAFHCTVLYPPCVQTLLSNVAIKTT
jgi:hypothetical protein